MCTPTDSSTAFLLTDQMNVWWRKRIRILKIDSRLTVQLSRGVLRKSLNERKNNGARMSCPVTLFCSRCFTKKKLLLKMGWPSVHTLRSFVPFSVCCIHASYLAKKPLNFGRVRTQNRRPSRYETPAEKNSICDLIGVADTSNLFWKYSDTYGFAFATVTSKKRRDVTMSVWVHTVLCKYRFFPFRKRTDNIVRTSVVFFPSACVCVIVRICDSGSDFNIILYYCWSYFVLLLSFLHTDSHYNSQYILFLGFEFFSRLFFQDLKSHEKKIR